MRDIAQLIRYESTVGKVLRLPLRLLPKGRTVSILSGPLRSYKWVIGAGVHGCWIGIYEQGKQKLFVQHLREGQVVYDIGAHVGFYTLLAAKLVGATGKVFAFEPLPQNVTSLQRHVDINGSTRVTIFPCAVADKPGEVCFDTDGGSYEGRIAATGAVKVPLVALDDLLAQGKIVPAQLVKIDVEGAERMVLEGGKSFFTTSRPTIFLATHGAQVHKECCDLLRSWGYELTALAGGSIESTDEVLAVIKR